jgi:hypothetical protein
MAGEASFVRLFGNRESAEAWEIRDFLKQAWSSSTGVPACRSMCPLLAHNGRATRADECPL